MSQESFPQPRMPQDPRRVADAQIAATAENPFRKAATIPGIDPHTRAELEEKADRAGAEAIKSEREKTSYRDEASINGVNLRVFFFRRTYGNNYPEGVDYETPAYDNVLEGSDLYELETVVDGESRLSYLTESPDLAEMAFQFAKTLASRGVPQIEIVKQVDSFAEQLRQIEGK